MTKFPSFVGGLIFGIASLSGSADCLAMGWLLAERNEVRSGQFNGFSIGMSKSEASHRMRELGGVDLMSATLPSDLIASSRDSIVVKQLLNTRNSIRIFDKQGTDIKVYFEDDRLIATNSPILFSAGTSRADVLKIVEKILEEIPGAAVEPTNRIDSAYWGALNRSLGRAERALMGYDGWHFIVPKDGPSGATYRLFFANERLTRIEYDRPRFKK